MRNLLLTTCLGAVAALAAGAAQANDELIKMSQNPKDWVMPAGDYANTRYSKLNQINASNVAKLQPAAPVVPLVENPLDALRRRRAERQSGG